MEWWVFDRDLDEKMRDALHSYIEARGVNESLFPFLQAWLYVKDHRNLMRWFKTVGTVINERKISWVQNHNSFCSEVFEFLVKLCYLFQVLFCEEMACCLDATEQKYHIYEGFVDVFM